jgi:hypothetical protein
MSQKNYAIVAEKDSVKYPVDIWDEFEGNDYNIYYVKKGFYAITDSQTPRGIYCFWFEFGNQFVNVKR